MMKILLRKFTHTAQKVNKISFSVVGQRKWKKTITKNCVGRMAKIEDKKCKLSECKNKTMEKYKLCRHNNHTSKWHFIKYDSSFSLLLYQ